MPTVPPTLSTDLDYAIAWFRKRVPMTDAEFKELSEFAKQRAFTVAGVTQLEIVSDVWKSLEKALADGEPLDEFKKRIVERLESAWGSREPYRLETIFRTNIQGAYGAGRYKQLTRPRLQAARPFWRYTAIMDSRTTAICRPLDGVILPTDHPFWKTHWPPLHFNCRSAVDPLTEEQAAKEGVSKNLPEIKVGDGFGKTESFENWEPDLEDVPLPLAKRFNARE